MHVSAVILAGGRGLRFGGAQPKQYQLLKGRSILEYALLPFMACPEVKEIILVVPDDHLSRVTSLPGWPWGEDIQVVAGGETRQQSSFRGVGRVSRESTHVFIHDAARPLVSRELLRRLLAAMALHAAVVPLVPVRDTLVRIDGDGGVVDFPRRSDFARVQTPQGFRAEVIRSAHGEAIKQGITAATDDCSLVQLTAGAPIVAVAGDERNRKITTPADLDLIRLWLSEKKEEN